MSQRPPYNIPSAWSPGLAVPDYIRREGLMRHAFVTLQAPDGTYDNPPVGSGGYVVPQYVLDEGYGQGAIGTKWDPRGSYFGPKIPSFLSHPPNKIVAKGAAPNGWTQYTIASGVPNNPVYPSSASSPTPTSGMGDLIMQSPRGSSSRRAMGDDMPIPAGYAQFGHKSATALIGAVQKLAPANRKGALKKALNAIDPSLWKRTADIANRYQKQGMTPAQALHAGLSRAMATGLAAEVVHTGMKRQSKPAAKGLLGLGCYGRAALPALGDTVVSKAGTTLSTVLQTNLITNAGPSVGECTSDGTMIWAIDPTSGTGFWRRLKAGESCSTTGGYTVTAGGTSGGVTVTDPNGNVQSGAGLTQAPPAADPNQQILQAGPFSIPLNVTSWTVHWSGQLPTDWQAFILPELAHDCSNCVVTSMEDATPGHVMGALRDFFDPATFPTKINKDLVGRQMLYIGTGSNGIPVGQTRYVVQQPDQPIVLVKRPDNGDVWGVYMSFVPKDPTKAWDSSSNPFELQLKWLPKPTGVWDWIKTILGTIVNAIGDALSAIGGAACDLLQSPAGVVGGAAVGAVVAGPAGAAAGAKGAQAAAGACGGPPPPLVLPPARPAWLLPVAIAGMGVAALFIMMPKRKKKGATRATHKPGGSP